MKKIKLLAAILFIPIWMYTFMTIVKFIIKDY